MALYQNGRFIDDAWSFPPEDATTLGAGPIALPRSRLLSQWTTLKERADPIGLVLDSGERLEGLEAIIPALRLIALRIPKYSDGRQYSIARRLRDQFAYRFELRATGDILIDQIQMLRRVGFDALEITHPGTISALRENRIVGVARHYQPASLEASEAKPGWRPWLRISEPVV